MLRHNVIDNIFISGSKKKSPFYIIRPADMSNIYPVCKIKYIRTGHVTSISKLFMKNATCVFDLKMSDIEEKMINARTTVLADIIDYDATKETVSLVYRDKLNGIESIIPYDASIDGTSTQAPIIPNMKEHIEATEIHLIFLRSAFDVFDNYRATEYIHQLVEPSKLCDDYIEGTLVIASATSSRCHPVKLKLKDVASDKISRNIIFKFSCEIVKTNPASRKRLKEYNKTIGHSRHTDMYIIPSKIPAKLFKNYPVQVLTLMENLLVKNVSMYLSLIK